uniref:Uncharacterized protein n=1 Tax=Arundo donax TaxID=35708 RepID=A0A0A9EYI2_ARUDO
MHAQAKAPQLLHLTSIYIHTLTMQQNTTIQRYHSTCMHLYHNLELNREEKVLMNGATPAAELAS